MGHYSAFTVAFAIANVLSGAFADDADTFSMTNVEVWQRDSEMQLSISANDGDIVPLTYTVIPLTSDIGLNESLTTRGKVSLQGKLALADDTTYTSLSGSDVIPYLCCDQMNNSYIQPSTMLNYLINNDPQPMAILLYSQQGQCCGLSGDNLNYQKFLTMPNADMASQVEGLVGSAAGTIRATVSGNFTQTSDDDDSQQGGSNSAIAMSVLYSITGVITLLFLVIIGTGAVRAHRYPERYGPRNGFGGRARQSRAKGIARAMLETLPIVKFGASEEPAKPDPNIELENASTETHANDNTPRHLSTIPESPIAPHANTEIVGDNASALSSGQENKGTSETNNTHTDSESADALGCSICTDDFTVGEDVRVLPCNHKFHPQCVDPWLVNVSGTCPLWYVYARYFIPFAPPPFSHSL